MPRYLILLVGVVSALPAATWQGRVLDNRSNPVPYTLVTHLSSGTWQIADEQGYFFLYGDLTAGDTLLLSRYGYRSRKCVLPIHRRFLVELTPQPVPLPGVLSHGHTNPELVGQGPSPLVIPVTPGRHDYRQALAVVPGLTLRSSGGPGGVGTLSMDGGNTTQLKVLVDGFDLTSAQTGVADLSQLPQPLVESIRYYPISPSHLGSGSGDGTIHLEPWSGTTGAALSRGSYGHAALHGSYALERTGLSLRLRAGTRHEQGNYPVVWWGGRLDERQNNFCDQTFLAAQLRMLPTPRSSLRLLYLVSGQERGLPGLIWSDSRARRRDLQQILGLSAARFTTRGITRGRLLLTHTHDQYFPDRGEKPSRHLLFKLESSLAQDLRVTPRTTLTLQVTGSLDSLVSTASGRHLRIIRGYGMETRWEPERIGRLAAGWRRDVSEKFADHTGSVTWRLPVTTSLLTELNLTGGVYYRYPTFNELYWQPGGNPGIRPEHSRNQDLVAMLNLSSLGTLQIQVFHKSSRDLIQWLPVQNLWRPTNIQHALRRGVKLFYRWTPSQIPIQATLSGTLLTTRNLTSGDLYGQPLRYAPRKSLVMSLDWQSDFLLMHGQLHYTDRRIAMYDWPAPAWLPETWVATTSLGGRMRLHSLRLTLILEVDNLLDTRYESTLGYPEPGRSFRLTFTCESTPKSRKLP